MHYSPTTGGFYSPDIHGPRTISVPDPAWARPLVQSVLQPGETFPSGMAEIANFTNFTEEPLDLGLIEDWRIAHPLIEIENTACLIPADAVEITAAEHAALIAGQSAGKQIVAGEDGRPILADPPAPSDEELAERARSQRNARLDACDWTVLADAPLTTTQKTAWKAYRQALRDLTDQPGFPSEIVWPEAPQ